MENSKKKQLIFSLIGIILLILFSVGMVYAFYNYTRQGSTNNVVNMADLTFEFVDSDWIWLENAYPLNTEQALALEKTGSSVIQDVDGGIAQFKVTGGHSAGSIDYLILLEDSELTETTTSKSGTFTLDPSTKIGMFPTNAISINLQTATYDIFSESGLVLDRNDIAIPSVAFSGLSSSSYINTENATSIALLPGNENGYILGAGTFSGGVKTRYFELRMWINDTVIMDDDLRIACQSYNDPDDEEDYGRGYCNSSTPNLPSGVQYVYSTGEFGKMYYSSKIKVEVIHTGNQKIKDPPPQVTTTLTQAITPVVDSTVENMFENTSNTTSTNGLYLYGPSQNSDYPIYYYRGNVNNHLLFANKCWRIVRTTETGGTKIIYDGVPSGTTCNNTGSATQISSSGSQFSGGNNIGNIGLTYNTATVVPGEKYIGGSEGNIVYGKNITYANGTYTLTDTITKNASNFYSDILNSDDNSIQHHRYTCFNNSSTCNSVYFIIGRNSTSLQTVYTYTLSSGTTIEERLESLLSHNSGVAYSSAYNRLNSWYTANLMSYSRYLEDTVFCNDRSVYDPGPFNPNNAFNVNSYLKFGAYGRLVDNKNPTLSCPRAMDKYTVSDSIGNGLLQYPIGLLTADEYVLAGGMYNTNNTSYYLNADKLQWTMTPFSAIFTSNGNFQSSLVTSNTGGSISNAYPSAGGPGYRPVVSLKSTVQITGGNGSSTNPFTVE